MVEEARSGDKEAAKKRLKQLKNFPHLEINKSSGINTPIICTPEELMWE